MTISVITTNSAAAATCTLPVSPSAGDLMLVYVARASATAATLGTGFVKVTGTDQSQTGGSASSCYWAWKTAVGGETSIPTFTNAGFVAVVVYRGTGLQTPLLGALSAAGLTTTGLTSESYPTFNTIRGNTGPVWVVAGTYVIATDTSLGTNVPTSMTLRKAQGTAGGVQIADTNGTVTTSAARTRTSTGGSYYTSTVQVFESQSFSDTRTESAASGESSVGGLAYSHTQTESVAAAESSTGVIPGITWDPANKSIWITLSNNNLTATKTSSTAGNVRSTTGYNDTGVDHVYSVTIDNAGTGGWRNFGFANTSRSVDAHNYNGGQSWGYDVDGNSIFGTDGTDLGGGYSGGVPGVGTVIRFRMNGTQAWVKIGADAETGPYSLTGLGTGLIYACCEPSLGPSGAITADFTQWASAAPAGATYNDVISESAGTAGESSATLYTVNGALTETAASGESSIGLFSTATAITETAAAGESSAPGFIALAAITETAAAGESSLPSQAFPAALTETAAAAESSTTLYTVNGALTEAAASGESSATLYTVNGVLTETAAAAESSAPTQTAVAAITETASATESNSAAGSVYNAALSETAAAAESSTNGSVVAAPQAETAAAAESSAVLQTLGAAATETVTAAESSAVQQTIPTVLAETAAAAESSAPTTVASAAQTETAAASESSAPQSVLPAAQTETAAAAESQTVGAAPVSVDITETAAAADSIVVRIDMLAAMTDFMVLTDVYTVTGGSTGGGATFGVADGSVSFAFTPDGVSFPYGTGMRVA